jgi:hypothetical protein
LKQGGNGDEENISFVADIVCVLFRVRW